jgi:hypothetical protein
MIARGIEAGWPRRLAARCTRARSAVSGRAQLCRLSRYHLILQFLWGYAGSGQLHIDSKRHSNSGSGHTDVCYSDEENAYRGFNVC